VKTPLKRQSDTLPQVSGERYVGNVVDEYE
jgi:hypothetical protein